jgi:hypothetical protein
MATGENPFERAVREALRRERRSAVQPADAPHELAR